LLERSQSFSRIVEILDIVGKVFWAIFQKELQVLSNMRMLKILGLLIAKVKHKVENQFSSTVELDFVVLPSSSK